MYLDFYVMDSIFGGNGETLLKDGANRNAAGTGFNSMPRYAGYE